MNIYMTFSDYIINPSHDSTRPMIVGQKELAKQVYTDKYNKMMLRTAGGVKYELFKNPNDDKRFTIFFKMPSETTDKLFYDVVIDFYTKDTVVEQSNSLKNYLIRAYTNDPNFVFTYAYVFNKNKLLIPELVTKLGKDATTVKPKTTNPHKNMGYVKDLYFAYLFMQDHGLFNKVVWANATKSNTFFRNRLNQVTSFERKFEEVQRLKQEEKDSKKPKVRTVNSTDDMQKQRSRIGNVKTVKTVSKIGHSPSVRRVKKIK